MTNRLWKILTSLRLTVILLAFGIFLVFVGTVAQADEGLYQAQTRYFKRWFVWGITMFGHKISVGLPGGYLIGTLLLANLTAAHIKRFQRTWKKLGIHLTHFGVILLLVGQLATDLFSRETQMRIREGQTRAFSENGMDYELAFIWEADATRDNVVAIPQSLLIKGGVLKHDQLPLTVRVKEIWPNSDTVFRAPMQKNEPPLTTNGIANSFDFHPAKLTHDMNSKNVPTAVLELSGPAGPLGAWVTAGWSGDETMSDSLKRFYQRNMGLQMGETIYNRLLQPQTVDVGGQKISFVLRPARVYAPFSFTLLKATHAVYAGTELPKDFRSRILVANPGKSENREVEIYMNNPLRYEGQTFFQSGMIEKRLVDEGETPWTVLQVVRNPSWLAPYAGCAIVGAGLIVQFMIHLVGFVSKRKAA